MIEFFSTLFLLAALQGLLLSVFLLTKKQNHSANLVLAIATLALSFELATVVYYSRGWYNQYPHFMGIAYPFPYLYGPLFLLYAGLISKKKERIRATDLLHFIPVFAVYCIIAPVFLYSGEEKIIFINNISNRSLIYHIIDFFIPIQGITYTILTIKTVADYNRELKNTYSTIDLINLNWLKYLTFGLTIVWSIVVLAYIAHIFLEHSSWYSLFLNFSLSALIYSIGYMGLKQPEIFLYPSSLQSEKTAKYKRSGLSDDNAEGIKRKLIGLMESEKPYLSKDLTLQKLAERLKISSHNLSEVINTKMHLTYYDFINQYRVEEFKNRLAEPNSEQFNLISIAFDSGFQSKGTFNTIFKKFTGMTPSEYKIKLYTSSK